MSSRVSPLIVLFALTAAASTARGQSAVRAASHTTLPAEDSSRVTLALAVGGQRFDEVKRGRCVHAPRASIFNTLSSMWMVNYAPAPGRSIALTVWRPMTGDTTPQINFNVSTGGKSQRIETVKATEIVGKGSVQITKRGAGGRFDIVGTTGDGATVRGYIECEKFAAPAPVGGN